MKAMNYLYGDAHQALIITILKEISIWQNPISNLRTNQIKNRGEDACLQKAGG